jgi:hypothetical protein
MFLSALILGFYLLTFPTGAAQEQSVRVNQQEAVPNMDEIPDRMKDHDEWQARYLVEYRAQRKFHAANLRFKEDATLEVMTTFRRPDTLESQVLRAEGSKLIRERVFDKILEAENEIQSRRSKQQVDIVPANYSFSYLGTEYCAERKCYRLGITPKRKEKYLIQGDMWVDAEDWGIVRVQGSPSKRPSFWTRKIQNRSQIQACRWDVVGRHPGVHQRHSDCRAFYSQHPVLVRNSPNRRHHEPGLSSSNPTAHPSSPLVSRKSRNGMSTSTSRNTLE